MKSYITHTENETIALGEEFARLLKHGDVIACFGDLGTGKTRFIKGVCKGLGVGEHVASPTFIIVNEYKAGGMTVIHFDFYRIQSVAEILDVGFRDYIGSDAICLIEWAERAEGLLPAERYDVRFTLGADEQTRTIMIEECHEVTA